MKNMDGYSDIAPFRDGDVRRVLDELVRDEAFEEVMEYVFPELSMDEVRDIFDSIQTVDDFQAKISYTAMKNIISKTVSDICLEGIENIDAGRKHLYISNHRDIILDSAFFNVLLFENNIETTETAIGNNLLGHPTVNALTKLNKNFTVKRGLAGRDLYVASMNLSKYIRASVSEDRSSIWISQREGRAKDGNDLTQKGLLKMLNLSNESGFKEGVAELNIRTLSISYEYDPCDVFKVRELLARVKDEEYVKGPDEDKMSIVIGITGNKGQVKFVVGKGDFALLVDDLEGLNESDRLQLLAEQIDEEIYRNYVLWPNNYLAYDMLRGSSEYMDKQYSIEQQHEFKDYVKGIMSQLNEDPRALEILLKKYAYPVINQKSIG